MKIVSLFAGHDANITFFDSEKNSYHVIEIERLVKKRYFRLHVDNSTEDIIKILSDCRDIAEKHWGFSNDYDVVMDVADGWIDHNILRQVFSSKEYIRYGRHHLSHAACAFYQSPFNKSLIISYDGGGDDGHFNIYMGDENGIHFLENIPSDFGGGYLLASSCITEVTKDSRHMLSLAGKMMGICAYGIVDESKTKYFSQFYFDKNWKKLSEKTGYNLKNLESPWLNPLDNYFLSGQEGFNFAATAQKGYENAFIGIFEGVLKKYSVNNVCITGGGGLNVLLNERIKNEYNVNLFVPPNPNDCGLSLGANFLYYKPKTKVNIAYNGLPLLDEEDMEKKLIGRNHEKMTFSKIANLLKEGKIIGVCNEDSEVGPRALGNRSIICDPSFPNMKDILNSKVKFREWYRPFAPFCLIEDANLYFKSKNFNNLEYMGYAPVVKKEYKEKLPSITHEDNSSRLQCVTKESHNFFYNLLKEFSKISDTNVLLNTSFNIRGNPILSTIDDALFVLDNTELDYVIIKDTLIKK